MKAIDHVDHGPEAPAASPTPRWPAMRGGHEAGGREPSLEGLTDRFRIEATERGVARVRFDEGQDAAADGDARRHREQARRELGEYLAGRRSFFTVPVDLSGVPPFQARVLEEVSRLPFGAVDAYANIARRIGRPHAARAVGNAVAANPAPILVPCHRVIRGDGTWGHYGLGDWMKTPLLWLEHTTPALVGTRTTRLVCRLGCPEEQRLDATDRVAIASLGEATGRGYRPCRRCQPSHSEP
jgi:methylated-DNA-[protein]-cysteine S-methyltransferase